MSQRIHISQKLEGLNGGQVPPQLWSLVKDNADTPHVLAARLPRNQDAREDLYRCTFSGAVWADMAHELTPPSACTMRWRRGTQWISDGVHRTQLLTNTMVRVI
jgi:hypothetical protein